MRKPGQQPPHLQAAAVALGCTFLLTSPDVAAAMELSGGPITGIVLSSVFGALLILLLALIARCLWRASRQTGDVTWAKTTDLEAADQTPHEPLPDASAADQAVMTRGGGGGGAGAGFQLDLSSTTLPFETDADAAVYDTSPTSAADYKQSSRGRSTGGGFGNLLGSHRSSLRTGKDTKDKHLQVSRSARVEPSAEVQMAVAYEPAATNMGPPLSKSSMLLRWLNGADDGPAEAVAAQLAAGDAAAGSNGAKGLSARSGRANTVGGGGGVSVFSDRLPLLSLAAQQSGIVWSKMPASVTSSPAVSLAESSSMHMLRGAWKRSDIDDTATSAPHTASAGGGGRQGGGDERYPPSLAQASVEALTQRNSSRRNRPGIVFDHVSTTPSNSRTTTAGGAGSRAPTVGGAGLPASSLLASAFDAVAGELVTECAPAAPAAPPAALTADDGFLGGRLPENMAAPPLGSIGSPSPRAACVAQSQAPPHSHPAASPGYSGDFSGSSAWLHQIAPTKLAALREAEEEVEHGELEAARKPPLMPLMQTPFKPQHAPPPPPLDLQGGAAAAAAAAEPSVVDGYGVDESPLPLSVRSGWTQFADNDNWLGRGRVTGGEDGCLSLSPEATMPLSANSRLTLAAISPLSPFLPNPPASGGVGGGSSGDGHASTSESGTSGRTSDLNDMAGEALNSTLRTNSAVVVVGGPAPSRRPAEAAPAAQERVARPLPVQRRVVVPSPVHGTSRSGSLVSQASVSPSLGVHYPPGGAWGAVVAANETRGSRSGGAAAEGQLERLPVARGKSLYGDDLALAALVQQASGHGSGEMGQGGARRGSSSAEGGQPASPS